jgi:hypothetical protein
VVREPQTKAGKALLAELAESPLPGARYAREVAYMRLAAIEAEAQIAAGSERWWPVLSAMIRERDAWTALALVSMEPDVSDARTERAMRRIKLAQRNTEASLECGRQSEDFERVSALPTRFRAANDED